jgi:exonuclease VII small subunit
MAKEEIKYEEALDRLERIVKQMENDELDIDAMGEQLKQAQKLIKLCKDKLTKADNEIKRILEKID